MIVPSRGSTTALTEVCQVLRSADHQVIVLNDSVTIYDGDSESAFNINRSQADRSQVCGERPFIVTE